MNSSTRATEQHFATREELEEFVRDSGQPVDLLPLETLSRKTHRDV